MSNARIEMNKRQVLPGDTGIVEAVRAAKGCPILFEVVPPKLDQERQWFRQHSSYLEQLFDRLRIFGINLPEIHDEDQKGDGGKRLSEFAQRVSPRRYARKLGDVFDTRYIINRVTVQAPLAEQEEWLLDTYHEYGLDTVVLVGGESGEYDYPGPSVPEGNRLVKEYLNRGERKYAGHPNKPTRLSVGNISIPTRRRENFDEPERMLRKIRSGTDFFTTQIVLDMQSPGKLLEDFGRLIDAEGITPPAIFWSFTPISEQKDVDFLRWLGVRIPEHVEERLLGSPDPVAASIDWAQAIWDKLQKINRRLPVDIPLGVNISVMGLRNFQHGIHLAEAVSLSEVPQEGVGDA